MLEKNDLIELKRVTVIKLREVDTAAYHLEKTDKRLNVYLCLVIDNQEEHNLYELLSILRFFRLLNTYIFKPKEVRKFILFYERLKFSGLKGRTRYKLTPIQVFLFANILGFWKSQCALLPSAKTGLTPKNYLICPPQKSILRGGAIYILVTRVNLILAKGGNSVWFTGSICTGFSNCSAAPPVMGRAVFLYTNVLRNGSLLLSLQKFYKAIM